jgi:Uma2 family endonuclease
VAKVWLIEPKSRTIRAFTAEKPDGYTLHENDTLTGEPVLPGWSATVKAVPDSQ